MPPANVFRQIKGKIGTVRHNFKEITRLVSDPALSVSYFPESERKPKLSIFFDHLRWLTRYGEVNHNYYVYGLDRKGDLEDTEVLPYNEFKRIRDSRNQHPNGEGYNYICILRDKFIFSQFLKSLGFPAPANLALLNRGQVTWLDTMRAAPLESLVSNPQLDINGFCKKLGGIQGEGAFPLRIQRGKLYVKEKEITLAELKAKADGQYLLQDVITQHPKVSELHPDSVNTIRLITFNNKGKVEIFCSALRIGVKGRSVDNWNAGGMVVGIDTETGRLRKTGYFKPGLGGRVDKHPDTGVVLDGFPLPFFQEGVKMVCDLHGYLYGIHSVGWDIAITPDGPIIIEGNDDWGGGIPMSMEKNFKSRFLKMFEE